MQRWIRKCPRFLCISTSSALRTLKIQHRKPLPTKMGSPENHPLNLNSGDFDPEAYVNHLLQRKGLDELVAVEEDMVQNVRRLDAEMQQLVYENYSKFLTATNIVRNMQTHLASSDEVNARGVRNVLTP